MAIDSYTTLTTAINDWSERTYASGKTDDFISLSEAKFNRILGPNYRRATSTTVTTNSSGIATLPTGFVHMRSFTRDLLGSLPLKQVSWEALTSLNPYANADDPAWFAISGTTLKVAPVCEDDFIAVHDAKLTALSGSNASNWLLVEAPDAYLFMCLAQAEAYDKNFAEASGFEAKAVEMVEELKARDVVAQFGNVEAVPDTVMP